MNCIIKKFLAIVAVLVFTTSCIIQNPKSEECDVKEITVAKIYEGGVKDIVFEEENGEFYYINRGLEAGYTLEGMREKLLDKKITLYLPILFYGTSNHIAQLVHKDSVIFTEFKADIIPAETLKN